MNESRGQYKTISIFGFLFVFMCCCFTVVVVTLFAFSTLRRPTIDYNFQCMESIDPIEQTIHTAFNLDIQLGTTAINETDLFFSEEINGKTQGYLNPYYFSSVLNNINVSQMKSGSTSEITVLNAANVNSENVNEIIKGLIVEYGTLDGFHSPRGYCFYRAETKFSGGSDENLVGIYKYQIRFSDGGSTYITETILSVDFYYHDSGLLTVKRGDIKSIQYESF